MELVRGSIIEVPLSSTNETFPEGASAQFLVLQVSVTVDRTVIAEVRSLGCTDAATEKLFSSRFNRKHGRLHVCVSAPCTHGELENVLHVTKMKLWTCRWEECPVLSSLKKQYVRKYLRGEEDREGDPDMEKPGRGLRDKEPRGEKKAPRPRRSTVLKRPSGVNRGRGGTRKVSDSEERKKEKKKRRKKEKSPGSEDIPEESRQKLKESLAALKERLTGTRGAKAADLLDPIEDGSEESVVPVGSDSELEGLTTGTSLKVKEKVKKDRKKKKEVREEKDVGRGRTSAAMKALEDTSGGTLRGLQSQLAKQAMVVSTEVKSDRLPWSWHGSLPRL